MREKTITILGGIIAAMTLAAALFILAGCSPKVVHVPVETVRIDTFRHAVLSVDTVLMRDSVSALMRGDTMYITKYRDRYKVRYRTDTVYQSMRDSVEVRVPYPVERKLTRWQQTKMDAGGMAIGAAVVLAVAVLWLVFMKRKK